MSQQWTDLSSGTWGNPELSKQQLAVAYKKMRLGDAVTPAKEYALNKQNGDKVAWRILGRIANRATAAINENQKVPFGKPAEYTATATVTRWALGIATTGVRRDVDRINVDEMNIRALRDHMARTHNMRIYNQLYAGRSFAYVATGTVSSPTNTFTTTGTPSGTAARNFIMYDVRKLARYADAYNIPPFDGENYVMFISPSIKENLLLDTATNGFIDIKKYTSGGAEGALNGEIGMAGGIRFVVDNDAMNQTVTTDGATVISEGIGSGSAFGSGFFCGADPVKEVVVYPPHFRVQENLSSDFGNQHGVCWQSLMAYCTEKNYTSHGEGTIIHYYTA